MAAFVEKEIATKDESPNFSHHDPDPEKFNDPKMQKLASDIQYADELDPAVQQHNPLAQKLRSRHMQVRVFIP